MSDYLNGSDSESENEKEKIVLDEATRADILQTALNLKTEANQKFSAASYEDAVKIYSEAIKLLKENGLDRDPILFLNRSASYMALKRFVPALNDANQGLCPSQLFLL